MLKKIILPASAILLFASCSGLKNAANQKNYDDVYFVDEDIDRSELYGKKDPNRVAYETPTSSQRTTRSYGQSYSDRFRTFGSNTYVPAFRPTIMASPMMSGMGFNPMYNPYMGMYNPYNPYSMYNPYGTMMYDPYMGYYNPTWCYYNQYYSPYYNSYWGGNTWSGGGSGSVNNNNNTGSTWGGSGGRNNNSFNNSGTRRSTFNSSVPANRQTTTYGSGTSTTSGSGSTNSGSTYYRQSTSGSGSGSSGSSGTYQRPSSSGSPSGSGGGGSSSGSQSGSNSRRR